MTTRPVGPASAGESGSPTPRAAPGFEALLERLALDTQDLGRAADAVEGPADLGRAVAKAHEALGQALELGSSLVEAYRQRLQQRRIEETP